MPGRVLLLLSLFCLESLFSPLAFAHGVDSQDGAFIEQTQGAAILPFIYLGAKHMVTGYDHLLFLLGVIFLLYRSRDVAITVSLFALGHSMTLVMGVLAEWQVNPWLIDALIGLSVFIKDWIIWGLITCGSGYSRIFAGRSFSSVWFMDWGLPPNCRNTH